MKFKTIHLFLAALIVLILCAALFSVLLGSILACLMVFITKYLKYKEKKAYIEKFDEQLIDGIDLIANSLKAGLTFQQSLNVLVEESLPPLSAALKEVINEHRLGVPIENALVKFAENNQNENMDLFVTAVNLTRETGGNLAEVLNKISNSMREKIRLEGHIKTLTSQGRMSGWVVGILPFVLTLIIYLVDKDLVMPMFTTTLGIFLFVIAIIIEMVGIFFIRKIINIDV